MYALPNRARSETILPIPFALRSCKECLQKGKGDYILLNLNNALQHEGATTVEWEYHSLQHM
jgi:hypothetical protein